MKHWNGWLLIDDVGDGIYLAPGSWIIGWVEVEDAGADETTEGEEWSSENVFVEESAKI